MSEESPEVLHLPARDIPVPAFLSPQAKAMLAMRLPEGNEYPPIDDKQGWRDHIAATEQGLLPLLQMISGDGRASVDTRVIDGVTVYDVMPENADPASRGIVLDMHGGGLTLCGGELCKLMARGVASRLGQRVWSVDYRMPPDHPYPAALDDGMTIYRALLRERAPHEIVFFGASAGGNLSAALTLRARDEGLPLPAAVILNTPEADLTESGDSFATNLGVDPGLRSLMEANLLYANGHDLAHPYLSPLFGDFTRGFPRTLLATGTRDLYLSNTVRMHRALRAAGIEAELHVVEAAGHGGFSGAPEGAEVDREMRRFVAEALG